MLTSTEILVENGLAPKNNLPMLENVFLCRLANRTYVHIFFNF